MTEEQKQKLIEYGKGWTDPNPLTRTNVYIPIFAGGELLWDPERRKHENQHLRIDKIEVEGKTVLDIGCNTGYISFRLIEKGAKYVVGVDNDPKILKICNLIKEADQVDNIEFIEVDKKNFTSRMKKQFFDNPVTNHSCFPFDVGLTLSNFDIDRTADEMREWGNYAKVWYLEPTNHPDLYKDKDEFKSYSIEKFSEFGDVEFLSYTDYQNRGLFKLTMNE